MTQIQSLLPERIKVFWQKIDTKGLKSTLFGYILLGYFSTFYFLYISVQSGSSWIYLWLSVFLYFWLRFNNKLLELLKPPVEVLLVVLIILYIPTFWYLNNRWTAFSISGLSPFSDIMCALIILIMGLILVINTPANRDKYLQINTDSRKYRQASLIFYGLLWFLFHTLFTEENYLHIVFQILLFMFLLSKTLWLETLTKRELWIYLVASITVFLLINDPSGHEAAHQLEAAQLVTWYSVPMYLHYFVKIYFLVLVVKIPVIMVYNHADLRRKLRIASIFQSSLPQLMQFVVLILIFFYFISGWQALNIRKVIYQKTESLTSAGNKSEPPVHRVSMLGRENVIFLPGYEPRQIIFELPEHGVLSLKKAILSNNRSFSGRDYFLYTKTDDTLQMVRLDTSFVRSLSQDLPLLTGSGLVMYPFTPREWQKRLYDNSLFEDDYNLNIFPFSFTTAPNKWSVYSNFERENWRTDKIRISTGESPSAQMRFVVGRVFIPVAGDETGELPYFAFDVYLEMSFSLFKSNFAIILLILGFLFLLADMLVIQRLGKFGTDITNIIIQKFAILKNGIRQISSGDLDYRLTMSGEDEFVELAGHFNEMGKKLKQKIEEVREKDKLDHELKIARQVQRSLLPEELPSPANYNIAASLTTANDIGGDFYDIIPLDENIYLFAIGDVSGKGSSAAFYMAQFISLLRFSPQFTRKPVEIASRLNSYFASGVKDRQIFVTSVIGILDTLAHTVTFVRTGHTPPVILPGNKKEKISEIKSHGLGIGLTRTGETFNKNLREKTIKLKPGDMFVLYTDGVIEAARATETDHPEVFGEAQFYDILNKVRDYDADQIEKSVSGALKDFYGGQAPVDDFTLLIIQRTKGDNQE